MAVFSGHQMFALPRSGILWIHEKYHKKLFASKTGVGSLKTVTSETVMPKPMPNLLEPRTKNMLGIHSH